MHVRWRLVSGPALVVATILVLGPSGPARAISYVTGDLVAILVDGNTELIVNLGELASLTPGTSFEFETPTGFGPDGATGAKFVAYETEAPFSGSLLRNATFTVEHGVIPPGYNGDVLAYVNRIGLAQLALDDGAAPADKFLQLLNSFPLPPAGGVISNTSNALAILTSNPASYTATLGVSGTSDRINNNLPFETDNLVGTTTDAQLWEAVKVENLLAQSTRISVLRVEGNVAPSGTPVTRITYLPEPEQWVLLVTALSGLGAVASLRRMRTGSR